MGCPIILTPQDLPPIFTYDKPKVDSKYDILLQDTGRCTYCQSTGDLDTNCRNCGAPLVEID